jgi:RNA polymerase sigma factor (sigma-70 family)
MDDVNVPSGSCVSRELEDDELVAHVRRGDRDAFAQLYSRHVQTALRLARLCSRRDAEDLCAEAFTVTLRAIRNGHGPQGPLKSYLSTVIRNTAATWSQRDRTLLFVGGLADLPDTASEADPALTDLDRALVVQAFTSLPERWRGVLRETVIYARSPDSVATTLRISTSATCSLAYRAREGLRQAYLQAHVARVASPACRPFAEQLAAFARGKLSPRRAAAERAHLAVCGDCPRALEALREIDRCVTLRPRPRPRVR